MYDIQEENLHFAGLDAPLRVIDPAQLRALLDPVFSGWPLAEAPPNPKAPFATLRPADKGRWALEAPAAAKPVALHDPVDAVCDLVVEMSWERLRSRPELLCLHAAALTFGDGLIIFPNARRAGKSLLTTVLARLGHDVFTDDFVPLEVDTKSGVIRGIANGIAPRLRLPVPDGMSAPCKEWIAQRTGPANKRYGYVSDVDLPVSGTAAPVGAVILLSRDPKHLGAPVLEPVTLDEALSALVLQNFGRQVHAGAILSVVAAVAKSVPVLRLCYDDVEEAAAFLHQAPDLQDLPIAQMPQGSASGPTRLAPQQQSQTATTNTAVSLQDPIARIPGYTAVEAETALFLADGAGVGIHRLNAVSMLIWNLLEEAQTGTEIVSILQQVYPAVPAQQLQVDTQAALDFLVAAGFLAAATGN